MLVTQTTNRNKSTSTLLQVLIRGELGPHQTPKHK